MKSEYSNKLTTMIKKFNQLTPDDQKYLVYILTQWNETQIRYEQNKLNASNEIVS